jgi:sulfoxide reductase heme-binding subunit YedZ
MRGSARRVVRHLWLAALFAIGTSGLFFLSHGAPPAERLSRATAFAGLAFLGATLMVGPLNERLGRPNPVSTNLRRDIGIWAAIGGVIHTIAGLQVHMKGDIVRYFVPDPATGLHISKGVIAFLSANYTGLGATLLLLVLLAISNDIALRTLGVTRWKRIQRLNYLLFALVVVHGMLYVAVDKSGWMIVAPFIAIVVAVLEVQLSGRAARRRIRYP